LSVAIPSVQNEAMEAASTHVQMLQKKYQNACACITDDDEGDEVIVFPPYTDELNLNPTVPQPPGTASPLGNGGFECQDPTAGVVCMIISNTAGSKILNHIAGMRTQACT
jgi:hypothetical protein